jgi:hypothetical protein
METVKVAAWRSYWWLGMVSALAIILTVAPVSRLAIHPMTVQISGETVFVHRTFPGDTFGLRRPLISYVETVKGFSSDTNKGHTCKDAGGPFRYSQAKTVGQWEIPWAAECLEDPIGYVWEACWRWHLGAIKLGPVCIDHTVMRANYEVTE